MNELLMNSACFGFALTLGAYLLGGWLKKKTGLAVMNPLLAAVVIIMAFLIIFKVDYKVYEAGARYVSFLLTPATV